MADQDGAATTEQETSAMPTGEPTMPMITVDGRSVPLDQASQVLLEKERSIQSGYDKKLADERANTARCLEADKIWYASHDVSLWGLYEATVDGGAGFTGRPEDLEATSVEQQQSTNDNAFVKDPEIAALRAELAEIKRDTQGVKQGVNNAEITRVATKRDELLGRYPNADTELVNLKLERVFNQTGTHATNATIETILKESHQAIGRRIAAATSGTEQRGKPEGGTTATPAASASAPAEKAKKVVSLEDPTFLSRIFS